VLIPLPALPSQTSLASRVVKSEDTAMLAWSTQMNATAAMLWRALPCQRISRIVKGCSVLVTQLSSVVPDLGCWCTPMHREATSFQRLLNLEKRGSFFF
jgi:hypothetical protein